MPAGSIRPSPPASRQPACASRQALKLSADDVPHNISRSSVRSATIFFSRAFSSSSGFSRRISFGSKPPYRVWRANSPPDCLQTRRTPVEVGRLTDPGLAADLCDRRAFLALLQDERLLRRRELRCLHRSQRLSKQGKLSQKLQFQTVQFSGGRAVPRHGNVIQSRLNSLITAFEAPPQEFRLGAGECHALT